MHMEWRKNGWQRKRTRGEEKENEKEDNLDCFGRIVKGDI